MDAYEAAFSTLVPEYACVMSRHEDAAAWAAFFGGPPETETFPHQQSFDWKSLQGRVASSSYAPKSGEPLHQPLMSALQEVFERHQRQGQVCLRYQTRLIFGQLH